MLSSLLQLGKSLRANPVSLTARTFDSQPLVLSSRPISGGTDIYCCWLPARMKQLHSRELDTDTARWIPLVIPIHRTEVGPKLNRFLSAVSPSSWSILLNCINGRNWITKCIIRLRGQHSWGDVTLITSISELEAMGAGESRLTMMGQINEPTNRPVSSTHGKPISIVCTWIIRREFNVCLI